MEFYIGSIICILIFGYVMRDEWKKDEKRVQDDMDRGVIWRFGLCMELNNSHIIIKDVKQLDDSKLEILESLCRRIAIEKNDLCLNDMKVALIHLASYQDGVGDEDLNPQGFDLLKRYEKIEELSAEEKLKFLTENADEELKYLAENSEAINKHKKRYEHFKLLCEKDEKLFFEKIGCSWPPKNYTLGNYKWER